MASLVWRVKDLVVEDREVKRETKTNWVGRRKIGLCDLSGILVRLQRLVGRDLALVAQGEFCEVAVVVSLPRKGRLISLIVDLG